MHYQRYLKHLADFRIYLRINISDDAMSWSEVEMYTDNEIIDDDELTKILLGKHFKVEFEKRSWFTEVEDTTEILAAFKIPEILKKAYSVTLTNFHTVVQTALYEFSEIKQLTIHGCEVSGYDFSRFKYLKKLEIKWFTSTQEVLAISNPCLQELEVGVFQNKETLNTNFRIDLSNLPMLNYLYLNSPRGIQLITGSMRLLNLENVQIAADPTLPDISLTFLKNCPTLKSFSLLKIPFSSNDHFFDNSTIQKLDISPSDDFDFNYLNSFAGLKELRLEFANIKFKGNYLFFLNIPIEQLVIEGACINDIDFLLNKNFKKVNLIDCVMSEENIILLTEYYNNKPGALEISKNNAESNSNLNFPEEDYQELPF